MNDNMNQLEPAQSADVESASLLPFAVAGLILVAMAYGGFKWWQVHQFETARASATPAIILGQPLKEFELEERGGEPFRSNDMRGKVWVVSYFFASCIGPCRILNGNIEELNNFPDLADVTWVSITCDPDNDSVGVLKQYAEKYHADPKRWLFCRSDIDYLKRVARGMSLALFIKTHSDHMVVIDRAGKIRGMFDGTSKNECRQLRVLLHECLAEKPPQEGDKPAAIDSEPLPVDPADCCDDIPAQPAIRSGT